MYYLHVYIHLHLSAAISPDGMTSNVSKRIFSCLTCFSKCTEAAVICIFLRLVQTQAEWKEAFASERPNALANTSLVDGPES